MRNIKLGMLIIMAILMQLNGEGYAKIIKNSKLVAVDYSTQFCASSDLVLDGLVNADNNHKLVPGLAKRWEWMNNNKKLRFYLRKNVYFHNGQKFDADSVINNFRAFSKKPCLSIPIYNFWDGKPKKVNDYTVDINFKITPGIALYWIRWIKIFSDDYLKQYGYPGKASIPGITRPLPMGTGCYIPVKGYSEGDRQSDEIVFKGNPRYWNSAQPILSKLVVYSGVAYDHKQALDLVSKKEGKMDIVTYLTPTQTKKITKSKFAYVIKSIDDTQLFGQINTRMKKDSPLKSKKVRLALQYALDRDKILKVGFRGNGVITPAVAPLNMKGYNRSLKPYSYDPQKAKQLLEEAGYTKENPLRLSIYAQKNVLNAIKIIVRMYKEVGIDTQIDKILNNGAEVFRHVTNPVAMPDKFSWGEETWDIIFWGMMAWDIDLTSFHWIFFHKDGLYRTTEINPEYQPVINQYLSTVDEKEREKLGMEMERIIFENAEYIYSVSPISLYAVNKEVEFVPHKSSWFIPFNIKLTPYHWSIRGSKGIPQSHFKPYKAKTFK